MLKTPKGEPVESVAIILAAIKALEDSQREDLISRLGLELCFECGGKAPDYSCTCSASFVLRFT